ncbi:uncharacterized protein N7518_002926 [Penicillium psychrosexuale]|uniref:uncharacterized protein n=1 Tax=Penicillium psychrosexuale TaxID=1002107 RepID=UPI0025455B1A|nr:uncharacterized protein N7518_002926 [Penicillium psychrosexuale]KAJ5800858.1 hypothetical protein N7518_002926 [Penicillium psychrosexuale]
MHPKKETVTDERPILPPNDEQLYQLEIAKASGNELVFKECCYGRRYTKRAISRISTYNQIAEVTTNHAVLNKGVRGVPDKKWYDLRDLGKDRRTVLACIPSTAIGSRPASNPQSDFRTELDPTNHNGRPATKPDSLSREAPNQPR